VLLIAGAACSSKSTSAVETTTPTNTVTASPTPGAGTTVGMKTTPLSFDPASVSIKVGETVTWRNVEAAPHTVASDSGEWETSALIQQNGEFAHTFANAGTFKYKCTVHPTMTGTVTVA